jgi:hypothetical protein
MVSLLQEASSYLDFSENKFAENTYKEKKRAFQTFFAGGFNPDRPEAIGHFDACLI